MFEKEADEFADCKNSFWRQGKTCIDSVRQAFQQGAAFGYNKAIAEIKDAYEGNGNFSAWFENYLEGKNV